VRRGTDHKVKSLGQLVLTQMKAGALLDPDLGNLPLIYQHGWPKASAETFALQTH
jgi:hypothetical protein